MAQATPPKVWDTATLFKAAQSRPNALIILNTPLVHDSLFRKIWDAGELSCPILDYHRSSPDWDWQPRCDIVRTVEPTDCMSDTPCAPRPTTTRSFPT